MWKYDLFTSTAKRENTLDLITTVIALIDQELGDEFDFSLLSWKEDNDGWAIKQELARAVSSWSYKDLAAYIIERADVSADIPKYLEVALMCFCQTYQGHSIPETPK